MYLNIYFNYMFYRHIYTILIIINRNKAPNITKLFLKKKDNYCWTNSMHAGFLKILLTNCFKGPPDKGPLSVPPLVLSEWTSWGRILEKSGGNLSQKPAWGHSSPTPALSTFSYLMAIFPQPCSSDPLPACFRGLLLRQLIEMICDHQALQTPDDEALI